MGSDSAICVNEDLGQDEQSWIQTTVHGKRNLLRKYIYGPGIDQPRSTSLRAGSSCMINPVPDPIGAQDSGPALSLSNGAVSYYHYDGLGSIVALSDEEGDTIQVYEYDVYGNVAASDPNHTNPFMFTGRRMDAETGLYFYRARYYNPALGRFLQTDPIGYDDGMNWYAYCGNNPVYFTDPSGQWCEGDVIYRMTGRAAIMKGYKRPLGLVCWFSYTDMIQTVAQHRGFDALEKWLAKTSNVASMSTKAVSILSSYWDLITFNTDLYNLYIEIEEGCVNDKETMDFNYQRKYWVKVEGIKPAGTWRKSTLWTYMGYGSAEAALYALYRMTDRMGGFSHSRNGSATGYGMKWMNQQEIVGAFAGYYEPEAEGNGWPWIGPETRAVRRALDALQFAEDVNSGLTTLILNSIPGASFDISPD